MPRRENFIQSLGAARLERDEMKEPILDCALPGSSKREQPVRGRLWLAVIAFALLQMHGAGATAPCARELGTTESTLIGAALRLRSISQAAKDEACVAYRQQVATVSRVREVFARCLSGSERDDDLRQLDRFIGDANDAVAASCRPRR